MNKPLCTFPWAHLDIETNGDIKYCCASVYSDEHSHLDEHGNHYNVNTHSIDQAWNSDRIRKLREDLYNGIQAPECQVCWEQEAKDQWSVRKAADQAKNDNYPNIQTVIDRSAENGFVVDEFPKYYQIQTGNMCNLACKMCHSDYSTTYGEFYQDLYPDNVNQNKYNSINDNKGNTHRSAEPARYTWPKDIGLKTLLEGEKITDIKRLFLSGGEPTIILENLDFLEHLVNTEQSKKIHLIVITNSMKINPRFAEAIKHFNRTTLTLSIDAVGDPIEIQRYPSSWERIDKNIIQYADLAKQHHNIHLAFNVVVSCLTLPNLDELLFYLAKNRKRKYDISITSLFSLVHGDLSLDIVPVSVLEKSKQRIRRALEINRRSFNQAIIDTVENFITSLDYQIERNDNDYTDIHFALDKIQEHHPDRDIKSIFPVYFS